MALIGRNVSDTTTGWLSVVRGNRAGKPKTHVISTLKKKKKT